MIERSGLCALAHHLRERQEHRDHRNQQSNPLVGFERFSTSSAVSVLFMVNLMFDLVLNCVRAMAHDTASLICLPRRCIEGPALRKGGGD